MDDEKELAAFEVAALITRQFNQDIDPIDQEKLENWKLKSENNRQLFDDLLNETLRELALNRMGQFDTDAAFNRLNYRIAHPVIPLFRKRKLLITIAAAATILIVFSVGLYVYLHRSVTPYTKVIAKNDVAPGSNKAILTLADGRKINVDDASNGTIARQSGVQIRKTNNGQLVYSINPVGSALEPIQYNTISVPNKGQYQVVLPDGTKVWLNSASSLRYPTRFEGNERLVSLTGEGYFEVAHNKNMPFTVNCQNQSVRVLGTHFNIHSYPDEAVVTTLLEGSVKVSTSGDKNAKEYILKPGQQAVHLNGHISIQAGDVAESIAWKDGQFLFHNTDLVTIMRQVQRWYDVQVDFNTLPDERFNGAMSRNVKLSQLLQMLELTSNLKFKIEERRIMLQK